MLLAAHHVVIEYAVENPFYRPGILVSLTSNG